MVSVDKATTAEIEIHLSERLKSRDGLYPILPVPNAEITSTSPTLHFSTTALPLVPL